jgi:glycosyltransferase involved in cell wall biosynthesis
VRIGLDATILSPATRYSGIGRYTSRLLQQLVEIGGHEYVAYGTPGQRRPEEIPDAVAWRPLPRLPLGKASAMVTHLIALPRLVAADRLDLLHVPTVHPRPSFPPVPRGLPCPLVVTLHDLIPITYYERNPEGYPWRLRAFFRWNLRALNGAAKVICVSETARREIIEAIDIDPERTVTVHNGVDHPGTPEHATMPQRPYVLYVGGSEPRKNVHGLLRGFAAAAARGLTHELVAVVGSDAARRSAIEAEVDTLGIPDRCRLVASVTDSELWQLYRAADVFVFPSFSEGFGFPPLEAMACGTPVIASDIPVLREVLGDAALFVDPADEQALACALLRLVREDGEKARLAEMGKERAAEFTWQACAEQTLAVLEQVAAERGRKAARKSARH